MRKYTNKLIILLLSIILLILTGSSLLLLKEKWQQPQEIQPVITSQKATEITYGGREGRDALSLLKEKTSVKQDDSGLVVGIGGYEADTKKREFWAFYVNGKMATVGPAEYMTESGERIEWKIETY